MKIIVELEKGVYLDSGTGDPSRTLVEASAKRYDSLIKAEAALAKARKFRPFRDAAFRMVAD